jgi:hypothetical protein
MLTVLQNKSIDLLDTVVKTLESYDGLDKRESYFAEKCIHNNSYKEDTKASREYDDKSPEMDDDDDQDNETLAPGEKFKHLSFELLDIGLVQTAKGFKYLKSTPIYQVTDRYINYEDKLEKTVENGAKLYRFLNTNVYSPLKENFYVVYDQSKGYISFMVKFVSEHFAEHQHKITDYVKEHYENVQIFVKENWLRLDFNNDGHVSKEDLKKGLTEIYDFIKNFEYYQTAVEIKSSLYKEAIKYMQKDLQNDEQKKESKMDENDSKIDKLLDEE